MTTTTLPSAADITRATEDDDYYADTLRHLDPAARAQFIAAVDQAYAYAHRPQPLTDTDKAIIAFAGRIRRREFPTPGHLEQAARDEFGHSATRYYQQLGWLLDRPEALAYAPGIIGPLRRQRELAQARRRLNPTGSTR